MKPRPTQSFVDAVLEGKFDRNWKNNKLNLSDVEVQIEVRKFGGLKIWFVYDGQIIAGFDEIFTKPGDIVHINGANWEFNFEP